MVDEFAMQARYCSLNCSGLSTDFAYCLYFSTDIVSFRMESIPEVGVSLAVIDEFVEVVGADRLKGLTTSQVAERYVMPMTKGAGCSYKESLAPGAMCAGTATVFASHAWSMEFDALIASLRSWCAQSADNSKAYVWLDVFVNNQHKAPSRPFSWWQTLFKDNVQRVRHTLLVLEWDAPKPLHRSWCLWEMACSCDDSTSATQLTTNAAPPGLGSLDDPLHAVDGRQPPLKLENVMPPTSAASFQAALITDFESIVYKTCTIDVARAIAFHSGECAVTTATADGGGSISSSQTCRLVHEGKACECPNDQQRIRDAVFASKGGFYDISKRLTAAMREWMVSAGRNAILSISLAEERHASHLQLSLANLLHDHGDLKSAEALLRESLAARAASLGRGHKGTREAAQKLALVLRDLGNFAEACSLLKENLAALSHAGAEKRIDQATAVELGGVASSDASSLHSSGDEDNCAERLTTLHLLAYARKEAGEHYAAAPLYREVLAGRRRLLGDSHADTLATANNLGVLLWELDELEEAEPLLRDTLYARTALLGASHHDAIISGNNVASLLVSKGDPACALPLLVQALADSRKVLGDAHPGTLACMCNTAAVMELLDPVDEADVEALYRECLALRQDTLGFDHNDTCCTLDDLVSSLTLRGRACDADILFCDAIASVSQRHGRLQARGMAAGTEAVRCCRGPLQPRPR